MRDVNVLVMSGFGLNCDTETAYAFELAGAKTQSIHINSLIDGSARLEDFQILVFIGGFSWADDHRRVHHRPSNKAARRSRLAWGQCSAAS